MSKPPHVPEGMHSLSPHLVCAGAADAIEFYKKAFGAEEMIRLNGPNGKFMHACLNINGSSVMLADESPAFGNLSPQTLKGTPVTMHLIVGDADSAAAKAVAAGATVRVPVQDMFWGDRYGVVVDPFGHQWSIATPQRAPMTKEELQAAAAKAMCSDPGQKS